MQDIKVVQQQNRELAERINQEARRDPNSQYAGKYVGLADGQIIIVAATLDEAALRLLQLTIAPERMMCFEAGLNYDEVQMIWSVA